MDVLVVGGTGFVGTHLCRELAGRGHHVTALSRNPDEADLPPAVDRVAGDVTDYDSIEGAFEGQDAVVFLTALSVLFKPKGGYERHFDVHLGGTKNAVRAAKARGIRKYVQMGNIGADPNSDVAFFAAKGQAEQVVRDSGLDWTIVRPSLLYGDDPPGEFISFTKLLAPPYFTPLPGGGKTRFQPIWIEDFVPIVADAVEGTASGPHAGEAEVEATDDEAEAETAGEAEEEEGEAEEIEETEETEETEEGRGEPTDPHVGKIYEIGGPEVLTLADVARLVHAADGKPVNVYSIPMGLTKLGLTLAEPIPMSPFGIDQYRSLKMHNTAEPNDIDAFGYKEDDLLTMAEFLGVDPAVTEPERA